MTHGTHFLIYIYVCVAFFNIHEHRLNKLFISHLSMTDDQKRFANGLDFNAGILKGIRIPAQFAITDVV